MRDPRTKRRAGLRAARSPARPARRPRRAPRDGDVRAELLDAAFAQSSIGVSSAEPWSGRIVRANRKFCELTGYTEAELRARTIADITHPDDRAASLAWHARVLRGDTSEYCTEKRYLRKDGTAVWVEVIGAMSRDAAGRPLRTIALVQDISARRATEEALQRTNALLGSLYASAPVLIGVRDQEGRLVSVNPRVLEITGLAEDQIIGRKDVNLLGGALSEAALEEDRRVMSVGQALSTEERAGDRTWEVTKSPWRDAQGRLLGVVVVAHDVSARKLLEERLRTREEHLREHARSLEWRVRERTDELIDERSFIETILDTAPALVIVLDPEGRIVRFNRACETVSGRKFEEVLGQSFFELLLPPAEADGVREVFARLRAGDFPNRHENHWRHTDGSERLIAWSNACVADAAGAVRYVMGTGVDITEQRRAERAARERLAEVAQLHRLHSMGEIAGLLAHQLNQPLTAIASYAEASASIVRRGFADPAELGDSLVRIIEQARRAARSIGELRAYLARGRGAREPAELAALARNACRMLEAHALACGVRLRLEAADGLPPVDVEPVQVEQVLANLVQNAIEAIQGAGIRAGTVRVTAEAEGSACARIGVLDDGPGFDAEAARRLFDPLYTTKPAGIGMGLTISRSIVEAHGGRIWAVPGRGGAIHFTLPFAR